MRKGILITLSVLSLLASTGMAAPQCEVQKFLADDSECGDKFGTSCSFASTALVIGASSADNNGLANSGSVYVYDWDGQEWALSVELEASDPEVGAVFGNSVSANDDRMAVASLGAGTRGAVYVFDLVQGIWTETAKLLPNGVAGGDSFAYDVALDGNVLLVGAPASGGIYEFGAAWVLEWDGSSWSAGEELTASDGSAGDFFGWSVAVSGTTAVIGARSDDGVEEDEGSAYIFEKQGSSWTEVAKLKASDAQYAQFGNDVAIDGDVIVVGARSRQGPPGSLGAVYAFERNLDGTWGPNEQYRIFPSDPENNFHFGNDVAIDGDRFVVASVGIEFGMNTGNVHVYDRGVGGWNHVATLLSSDANRSDLFGGSVAILGELVLAGALGTDEADPGDIGCNSGAAYLYQIPPNTHLTGFGSGCPCGNDDPDRGCVNSRGDGSLLAPCGSTSVSADDFALQGAFVPVNQFGLAFMGGVEISAPFGDGQRRVGTGGVGLFRYQPAIHTGPLGRLTLGPGIVSLSQGFPPAGRIDPGETWYFQLWYRDPMGSPCGAQFNLSNAVAATFVP